MDKKYIIYKTTNTITNEFYIGMHSTNNIHDGYLGSGTRIKHSIEQYGVENHTRKIIEYCDSPENLRKREREIVNWTILNDPLCLNIRVGGKGGWTVEQQRENNRRSQKVQRHLEATNKEWVKQRSKRLSEANRRGYENGSRVVKVKPHVVGEFKHTDEAKHKIADVTSKAQRGEGNSQYGTMWITNNVENRKVKKTDTIPDGWRKGRVLKSKGGP